MALTTVYANNLLNASLKAQAVTWPTSLEVALYSVAPTAASTAATPTGTEFSGGSYVRQTVTLASLGPSSGTAGNSTAGSLTNTTAVTFPAATTSEGTLLDVGLLDQTGQLLVFGAVATSTAIVSPDQVTFPAGSLVFTLA